MRSPELRSFTLVELLVVVAIIVVLISILLPGMESAVEAAQTAVCQNNFRNLGVSTRLYLNDYSQTYMNHRHTGPEGDGNADTGGREMDGTREKWWATDLMKLGMSVEAFRCPTIAGASRKDHGVTWQWSFNQDFVGYGYNSFFLGRFPYGEDFWSGPGFKANQMVQPSMNINFAETHPTFTLLWSQSLWWPNSATDNGYNEGVSINRHRSGSVVGFGDGHNEVFRAEDINPLGPVVYHPHSIKYWDPLQRTP